MEKLIKSEIKKYVLENKNNCFEEINDYFKSTDFIFYKTVKPIRVYFIGMG